MDLESLKKQALQDIKNASHEDALEAVRVQYLGRERGELTLFLRSLANLSLKEKRAVGPKANALRRELERALRARRLEIGHSKNSRRGPAIDVTAPGIKAKRGHMHPLTRIDEEVRSIFRGLNFSIVEGQEIESEHYNFDALNIPADHPARDMWDTFWLKDRKGENSRMLLRTHTSPMQIRYMERHKPPIQIIVPGRVFRFEATDHSHETNFYQVEGLMVGEDIALAHFKYVIEQFLEKLFHKKLPMRFRPSYFPFTEPSLEVDIKWRGAWLEIMGAGMVHPNVFKAAGYNPHDVQGFAFGVGLERLAMIKYHIPDIRLFYSGDLRFIHQF